MLVKEDGVEENENDDEIKEDHSTMKSKQSTISLSIESSHKQLNINCKLVKQCDISFYKMNTELLFSINPFTFSDNDNNNNKNAFNYVSPSTVLNNIELDDNKNTIIDIPKELHNTNVFIRVDSVDDIDSINQVSDNGTFYDNQLIIQIKERYGKIKVLSKKDNKPISKAYIKVFAKMKDGYDKHEFYKDGYTDIRGKFD